MFDNDYMAESSWLHFFSLARTKSTEGLQAIKTHRMACQSSCQNVPILEHLSLGVMDAYVPGITASSFKGRNCFSSIFASLASSRMSEPQYLCNRRPK